MLYHAHLARLASKTSHACVWQSFGRSPCGFWRFTFFFGASLPARVSFLTHTAVLLLMLVSCCCPRQCYWYIDNSKHVTRVGRQGVAETTVFCMLRYSVHAWFCLYDVSMVISNFKPWLFFFVNYSNHAQLRSYIKVCCSMLVLNRWC